MRTSKHKDPGLLQDNIIDLTLLLTDLTLRGRDHTDRIEQTTTMMGHLKGKYIILKEFQTLVDLQGLVQGLGLMGITRHNFKTIQLLETGMNSFLLQGHSLMGTI